ncbi:MAG: ACT domain-containing protein [Clostridia bacterium]|nr:ACT domain-containing protein [Clostridia bacterium]
MQEKYLIIDKAILPDYYEKVIEARELVESRKAKDVSEAVRKVGISRSTYYKYKDYIFAPNHDTLGKKAVIAFNLAHKAGALSETLKKLTEGGANILTINQNLPIGGKAHVLLSLDTQNLKQDMDALIRELAKLGGVSGVRLIAIE